MEVGGSSSLAICLIHRDYMTLIINNWGKRMKWDHYKPRKPYGARETLQNEVIPTLRKPAETTVWSVVAIGANYTRPACPYYTISPSPNFYRPFKHVIQPCVFIICVCPLFCPGIVTQPLVKRASCVALASGGRMGEERVPARQPYINSRILNIWTLLTCSNPLCTKKEKKL